MASSSLAGCLCLKRRQKHWEPSDSSGCLDRSLARSLSLSLCLWLHNHLVSRLSENLCCNSVVLGTSHVFEADSHERMTILVSQESKGANKITKHWWFTECRDPFFIVFLYWSTMLSGPLLLSSVAMCNKPFLKSHGPEAFSFIHSGNNVFVFIYFITKMET